MVVSSQTARDASVVLIQELGPQLAARVVARLRAVRGNRSFTESIAAIEAAGREATALWVEEQGTPDAGGVFSTDDGSRFTTAPAVHDDEAMRVRNVALSQQIKRAAEALLGGRGAAVGVSASLSHERGRTILALHDERGVVMVVDSTLAGSTKISYLEQQRTEKK